MTYVDWAGFELSDICRAIGIIGFLTYVGNYTCLSLRVFSSDQIIYFALNIAAATMVLISLTQDFNLPSALIQGFWVILGLAAILTRSRQRRSSDVVSLRRKEAEAQR